VFLRGFSRMTPKTPSVSGLLIGACLASARDVSLPARHCACKCDDRSAVCFSHLKPRITSIRVKAHRPSANNRLQVPRKQALVVCDIVAPRGVWGCKIPHLLYSAILIPKGKVSSRQESHVFRRKPDRTTTRGVPDGCRGVFRYLTCSVSTSVQRVDNPILYIDSNAPTGQCQFKCFET